MSWYRFNKWTAAEWKKKNMNLVEIHDRMCIRRVLIIIVVSLMRNLYDYCVLAELS
jgi:hypothetical protein